MTIFSPRTWLNDELVTAAYGNDWQDQEDELRGATMPDGAETITATVTAAQGATTISISGEGTDNKLRDAIPVGRVLAFTDHMGVAKYARVTAPAARGATSLTVAHLAVSVTSGLKAFSPGQSLVELQSGLQVATGVSFPAAPNRGRIRNQFLAGSGSLFRFIADKATTPMDNDYSQLLFVVRNGAGTEEQLARVRAIRDGSAIIGTVQIWTASGGSFRASPDLILRHSGHVYVLSPATPHGRLDVNGDLSALEFVGLALWREPIAGTASHAGSARVTNQIKSTAGSGAPFTFGSAAKMVKNLNVDLLDGLNWPAVPITNNNNVTVTTPATLYTVATATTTEAGRHRICGQFKIDVAANDVGARFSITLPGGVRIPQIRAMTSGQVIQASFVALYSATASEALLLRTNKDAGTGSTVVTGNLLASRYGS